MTGRRLRTRLTVLCALAATSCSGGSIVLPGSEGGAAGDSTVRVELANMSGINSNAVVMVDNVNVGTVTDIGVENWHAVATLRINNGVELPANASAKIAQTSLLGSKHIELAPPDGEPAVGRLADGATVPLSRTRPYPETEDVLASVSLLLNGGGLQNVQTITTELNKALGGREPQIRETLDRLQVFAADLDRQKEDIRAALDGMDRLAAQAAGQTPVINRTLDELPPALQALNDDRTRLRQAMLNMSSFSDSASGVLQQARDPLTRNLTDLQRSMKALAESGDSLVRATDILATGPFPLKMMTSPGNNFVKGDFANLYITLDLTNEAINDYYLELARGALPGPPGQNRLPEPRLPANPLLLQPLAPQLLPSVHSISPTPASPPNPSGGFLPGLSGNRGYGQ